MHPKGSKVSQQCGKIQCQAENRRSLSTNRLLSISARQLAKLYRESTGKTKKRQNHTWWNLGKNSHQQDNCIGHHSSLLLSTEKNSGRSEKISGWTILYKPTSERDGRPGEGPRTLCRPWWESYKYSNVLVCSSITSANTLKQLHFLAVHCEEE